MHCTLHIDRFLPIVFPVDVVVFFCTENTHPALRTKRCRVPRRRRLKTHAQCTIIQKLGVLKFVEWWTMREKRITESVPKRATAFGRRRQRRQNRISRSKRMEIHRQNNKQLWSSIRVHKHIVTHRIHTRPLRQEHKIIIVLFFSQSAYRVVCRMIIYMYISVYLSSRVCRAVPFCCLRGMNTSRQAGRQNSRCSFCLRTLAAHSHTQATATNTIILLLLMLNPYTHIYNNIILNNMQHSLGILVAIECSSRAEAQRVARKQ